MSNQQVKQNGEWEAQYIHAVHSRALDVEFKALLARLGTAPHEVTSTICYLTNVTVRVLHVCLCSLSLSLSLFRTICLSFSPSLYLFLSLT